MSVEYLKISVLDIKHFVLSDLFPFTNYNIPSSDSLLILFFRMAGGKNL